MEMERVKIELTVNGRKVCKYVAPAMRLADFLREELHLIGTKKGCNAGECGTCSVLIDGVLKKSCLIPVMIAVTAMGIFENVEKAFECISRQDEVKIYLPDDKKILEYERYRAQMNRIYKRVWGEKQKDGRFEFHI